MSAEMLRKAAATLRERANAAPAMDGQPWRVQTNRHPNTDGTPWGTLVYWTHPAMGAGRRVATWSGEEQRRGCEYAATMHPSVGLALADWLDDEAKAALYHENRVIPIALTVARLIVGDESILVRPYVPEEASE